jgi:hypothetical protein
VLFGLLLFFPFGCLLFEVVRLFIVRSKGCYRLIRFDTRSVIILKIDTTGRSVIILEIDTTVDR